MTKNTPHIAVNDDIFSKTVLMPGDPKRAEMVAKNFLHDTKIISDIRGIKAIKGFYYNKNKNKDTELTVMASGMGMPSIGIYSHELFNFFDVDNIIRIGSVGAINKNLKLGDIVIAQSACTNSNYLKQYELNGGTFCPIADYHILETLVKIAREKEMDSDVYIGNILSSDTFYGYDNVNWEKLQVLATEMESAALFSEAMLANKKAGTICTVSDLIFDHSQSLSPLERENNLTNMIEIALDAVEEL